MKLKLLIFNNNFLHQLSKKKYLSLIFQKYNYRISIPHSDNRGSAKNDDMLQEPGHKIVQDIYILFNKTNMRAHTAIL